MSDNYHEQIQFFLVITSAILGCPWLARHNGSTGSRTGWSVTCHSRCLDTPLPPMLQSSDSPPVSPDLSVIPKVYHNIGEVFSQQRAFSLPSDRPYNCAFRCTAALQPALQPFSTGARGDGEVHQRVADVRADSSLFFSCQCSLLFCERWFTASLHRLLGSQRDNEQE